MQQDVMRAAAEKRSLVYCFVAKEEHMAKNKLIMPNICSSS